MYVNSCIDADLRQDKIIVFDVATFPQATLGTLNLEQILWTLNTFGVFGKPT